MSDKTVSEDSQEVASEVIFELGKRKGFDSFWGMIDADIKDNIETEIAEIIQDNYQNNSEMELIEQIITHTIEHHSKWDEFRKTFMFFVLLSGVDDEIVSEAYLNAIENTNGGNSIEISDAIQTVEQYQENQNDR